MKKAIDYKSYKEIYPERFIGIESHSTLFLNVYYNDEHCLNDIYGIEEYSHVEHLNLNFHSIEDISPLFEFKNLNTLSLIRNKIEDISPILNNKNLETLVLSHNPIQTLDNIHELNNLRNLNIVDSIDLTTSILEKIFKCTNLKYLNYRNLGFYKKKCRYSHNIKKYFKRLNNKVDEVL